MGCAVATPHGAELARARLAGDDFYVPAYRRLFAAAVGLNDVDDENERIARAADAAGLEEVEVRALVEERSVMWDSAGSFARRVAEAARRRHAMEALGDAFNALGEGADPEEVRWLLEAALAS